MDQYLSDPETYESQLIKLNGVAKTAASVAWPAEGSDANMTIWDGFRELLLRIDPTQTSTARPNLSTRWMSRVLQHSIRRGPPCITTGIRSHPICTRTSRAASTLRRTGTSRCSLRPTHPGIVLNDTAQTVTFRWAAAVDLNGDNVIYSVDPGRILCRSDRQCGEGHIPGADGQSSCSPTCRHRILCILKWAVATKDPTHPAVVSKDTLTVKLVRGTITGVARAPGNSRAVLRSTRTIRIRSTRRPRSVSVSLLRHLCA